MAGATVGAVVGVGQWLLLRRKASQAGWWILASTLGYAVNLAVAVGVHKALIRMWARGHVAHFSYEGSGAVGGDLRRPRWSGCCDVRRHLPACLTMWSSAPAHRD